jgi:Na+-driven multidrug efflux pump/anti-sigma regulatory factor (Ser/Thr protein kinase)
MELKDSLNKSRIVRSMFTSSFITMLLASIALLIGTLVDGIMIGNFLDTTDMAAYGLIHPVAILLLAVTGIFSSGSQIICTKHMSIGESEKANGIFSLTFIMLLFVSGILTAVFIIFATPVVQLLGARGELLPLGREYLLGLAVGFPGVLLATTMAPFAQLDGHQKITIISIAAMIGVNVAAAILNVTVFHGGLFGMGMATSLGSYAAFVIALIHFLTNKKGYRLTLKHLPWKLAGKIILPGLPTAGGRLFATFRTLFLNYLLIAISTSTALAAYSARMNIGTFFAATGVASGMTTLSLTGIFFGEEDRTSLSKMFKVVTVNSVIIATAIMIFLLAASEGVIDLYMNTDAATLEMTSRSLRFCALSLPFYAVNNILINYLQAIRRVIFTNILIFCQNIAFCIPFALFLSPYIGTDAVWSSYLICEILTTLLYLIVAYLYGRKRAPSKKNLLMLSDSFGIDNDDLLEGTITCAEELPVVCMKLEMFCLSRNSGEDKTAVVVTAFEEMTKNILTHGFCDGKKHTIDYRIFKKGDDYVLRLRDNCKAFNPMAKLDDMDAKGDTQHMGIRVASVVAKDINYISIMNMNNLILTV